MGGANALIRFAIVHARRFVAIATSCFALLALAGCVDLHTWVEKEPPWSHATIEDTEQVRVEGADGRLMTLEHPRIGKDERGNYLAGRTLGADAREVRLDLTDVRVLEVQEVDAGRIAASIAAGILVVAAVLLFVFQPFSPSA